MSYHTSALGEGVNRLTVTGTDKVGNRSEANRSFDMRVDRTPPGATYGGSIASLDGQSVESSGDPYTLRVDASDGDGSSAASARSGVRAIDIEVIDPSGTVVRTERKTQDCPGGSCPMTHEIDFNPETEGSGTWRFRVSLGDHSQPSNVHTPRTFSVTFTRDYPAVTLQSDQAFGLEAHGAAHLDDVKNLGVGGVRLGVSWLSTVQGSRLYEPTMPCALVQNADRTEPANYNFAELERKFTWATQRGLAITLQLDAPIPCWASEHRESTDPDACPQNVGDCAYRPSVARYREWLIALARKFGSRVNRWAPWNEPNLLSHLAPQDREWTPQRYRELFLEARDVVATSQHGGVYSKAPFLFGEVTFSQLTEGQGKGVDAQEFLLAAACHPRPFPNMTADRPCPDGGSRRIHATEMAFHSYVGTLKDADDKWSGFERSYVLPQDNVTHIRKARDTLSALRAAGRVSDDLKWVAETESGVLHGACYSGEQAGCSDDQCRYEPAFDCDLRGFAFRDNDNGERKQAAFLNCMEMNAWKGGNVARFSQYLLQEGTPGSGTFFSALRRRTNDARPGTPKASYNAFRQPLVVYRHDGDKRLEVWGAWRQKPRPTSIQLVGQDGNDANGQNDKKHTIPLPSSRYFHRFLSLEEAPGGLTWLTVGPDYRASRRAHGGDCGADWTGGDQP